MNRQVRALLRLEGLVVLALAVALYVRLDGDWLLFAALFLVPDISMVGFLGGRKAGAACYNLVHTYLGPGLLAGAAWLASAPHAASVAIIWSAHIGFDRLLGYGLKLPTGFRHTHLGRFGRAEGRAAEPRTREDLTLPDPDSSGSRKGMT